MRRWLRITCPNNSILSRRRHIVQAKFNWLTSGGRYLDLLLKVKETHASSPSVIIGIENKIEARESEDQIADYQSALILAFPRLMRKMFFLTPDGRPSQTSNVRINNECPCTDVSWITIIQACRSKFPKCNGDTRHLLDNLANFIEYRVLQGESMTNKAQTLINELMRDPNCAQGIRYIRDGSDYVPTIRNIMYEQVLPLIREKVPYVEIEWHYPKNNRRPHEFNFNHFEFNRSISRIRWLPVKFYYMFYARDRNPDIGKEIGLFLMARREGRLSKRAQNAIETIKKNLPQSENELRQWDKWTCLWAGEEVRLINLRDNDLESLKNVYLNGYKKTFEKLKAAIEGLA